MPDYVNTHASLARWPKTWPCSHPSNTICMIRVQQRPPMEEKNATDNRWWMIDHRSWAIDRRSSSRCDHDCSMMFIQSEVNNQHVEVLKISFFKDFMFNTSKLVKTQLQHVQVAVFYTLSKFRLSKTQLISCSSCALDSFIIIKVSRITWHNCVHVSFATSTCSVCQNYNSNIANKT